MLDKKKCRVNFTVYGLCAVGKRLAQFKNWWPCFKSLRFGCSPAHLYHYKRNEFFSTVIGNRHNVINGISIFFVECEYKMVSIPIHFRSIN